MNRAAEEPSGAVGAVAGATAGSTADAGAAAPPWPAAKRVAFRFLAAYFVLFSFPFPLTVVPWLGERTSQPVEWAWRQAARWVGDRLLGIREMRLEFTGSGDTTFDYVRLLIALVLAAVAAALWSALGRRRGGDAPAARWLVVAVRFFLGYVLVSYGLYKVVPVQFPPPSLARLLTPYGESSPMGIVWTFMGTSPAYTAFTGAGELAAGLFLFWHRTRTLGAAVATAVLAQVVALNFCYDVPVKLLSSHLLLMAAALLGLDRERLAAVFWSGRAVAASPEPPLLRGRRTRRIAAAATALAVGAMVVAGLLESLAVYRQQRAERSSLWGVHAVERFVVDGVELPPLVTDELRWRALVVDREKPVRFGAQERPGGVSIQLMSGALSRHPIVLDEEAAVLTFLPPGAFRIEDAGERPDRLSWERPAPGRLLLRGTWRGRAVEIELAERPPSDFLLLGRGFHWINETPYNR